MNGSDKQEKTMLAIAEGPSVSLTGRGYEVINRELKAEVDGLPEMPLSIAQKTIIQAEGSDVWVVAVWLTLRRILARAVCFSEGERALMGDTVSMPMESSSPDEALEALIIGSAKNNTRKLYSLGS